MSKKIITFGDIEIGKHKFHYSKDLILLEDVDIDNILCPSNEKNYNYFISYKDYYDYKTKALLILLSIISSYLKSYDGETSWMYFLIENDELLK